MNKTKSFASGHPLTFSLVVTLVYILMLFFSAVLGAVWPGKDLYGQPGSLAGRLISLAILLLALSRLGWLGLAGFSQPGRWGIWLILPLPLAYAIVASAYAMTERFSFNFAGAELTGRVTLFILAAAFLEEIVFRGWIMYALARAWGGTNNGLIRSVLVSSIFFSALHLLDIFSGRPLPNVLLQSLQAFFLGVFLGTLVLTARSIYPAAFFHGILNLAGYLIFAGHGLEPAPSAWLSLSLLMLPLAVFGISLLRSLPNRTAVPEAA